MHATCNFVQASYCSNSRRDIDITYSFGDLLQRTFSAVQNAALMFPCFWGRCAGHMCFVQASYCKASLTTNTLRQQAKAHAKGQREGKTRHIDRQKDTVSKSRLVAIHWIGQHVFQERLLTLGAPNDTSFKGPSSATPSVKEKGASRPDLLLPPDKAALACRCCSACLASLMLREPGMLCCCCCCCFNHDEDIHTVATATSSPAR